MNIQYISWNYGRTRDGVKLHLIRLKNGQGLLRTDEEMVRLGLAEWKVSK